MISDRPQIALLFMPDISGFTQFVTETEINHSQHIIRELLEILIDTNNLGLEVSEVEGDAIFFYKPGQLPDLPSLLTQVEKMFTRFHSHLKLYEYQRICPCGACKTAANLSLKIIIHAGEVTGISIKEHRKLFGRDVILVHRLLKNNLAKTEYVLLTEKLLTNRPGQILPAWYIPEASSEQYDAGEVKFHFSDLSELHRNVIVNPPEHRDSLRTKVAFSEKELIKRSMENVFASLLGMERKLIRGISKKVQPSEESILRIGEKHPCLITGYNSTNITESVKVETESIEMVEMNETGIAGYRYTLKKISGSQSTLEVQMLIRNNFFIRIAFAISLRAKMMKRIREFFESLEKELPVESIVPGT